MELAIEWFAAFGDDADEQAGRPRGVSAHDMPDRTEMLRRIRAGQLWFWRDESTMPVQLIGVSPAVAGGSPHRAGVHPAFATPPRLGQQRGGRGFATTPSSGSQGVPVHRPGQSDIELHLRRSRLPTGR